MSPGFDIDVIDKSPYQGRDPTTVVFSEFILAPAGKGISGNCAYDDFGFVPAAFWKIVSFVTAFFDEAPFGGTPVICWHAPTKTIKQQA